jgi:TldD protein
MMDTGLQLEVIKKALSHGGEYADLFVEHRKQTSLILEDGKIEKIIIGSDSGAGVRLVWNGKTSYAYSNDLTKEALMRAASEVSKAAAGGPSGSVIDLTVRKPAVTFEVARCPADVPIEKKIAIVSAANDASRGFDGRIKQVTAIYRDSVQDVRIASSDGFVAEDERIYTSAIIQVIAVHNSVIQTGYESIGGFTGFEMFEKNDIRELAGKAAARAVMMLTARKVPGGRMPVVISSSAGGTMIHEAIGHGLEADLAQRGLSVFSGKKGGRVASELVTVIDDSTLLQRRGSFRFDDEGTPSQKTVLVEKGVLRNYMYDKLTAMNDNARSTANGRRESYRYRPIPRMTNTFIARGETPPEEIVASLERGLLVQKMGGGQVNTVTGDFVFDVQEGYLIEKGLRGEPVRGATLTGNGPQILESIDMVGSDQGFSIGTCGKDSQGVPVSDAMPTVRVPEMVVGGTCGSS